ncbi:hypothetical protein R1flu_003170 [Riccia fluitans]|uniref:Uncharacterized protein n=1 Tax=Riccia fluitans TaxID=41844 RepID=A0ABD1Y894_9MARC
MLQGKCGHSWGERLDLYCWMNSCRQGQAVYERRRSSKLPMEGPGGYTRGLRIDGSEHFGDRGEDNLSRRFGVMQIVNTGYYGVGRIAW